MDLSNSPLSEEEIYLIEATCLPIIERHRLRLLAHCLAAFKGMKPDSSSGELPTLDLRLKWCLDQQQVREDPAFMNLLLDQFSSSALQLEKLAHFLGLTPIELSLDHLISAAINDFRKTKQS